MHAPHFSKPPKIFPRGHTCDARRKRKIFPACLFRLMRQRVTGICKAGTRPLQIHLLYGGQVQGKSIHKVDLRGSSWEDQLALPGVPKEPGHSKLCGSGCWCRSSVTQNLVQRKRSQPLRALPMQSTLTGSGKISEGLDCVGGCATSTDEPKWGMKWNGWRRCDVVLLVAKAPWMEVGVCRKSRL